jgi:hypothetical protein
MVNMLGVFFAFEFLQMIFYRKAAKLYFNEAGDCCRTVRYLTFEFVDGRLLVCLEI